MANLERIVSIIFAGEDRVSKTALDVGRNLGTLTGTVEGVAVPFARLADGIIGVDQALLALGAGGLVYAAKTSIEYENAVANLNKVLDEQTESLDGATAKALEFSDKYGSSFTDIIGQITAFKQAGFELSDSLKLTDNALKLMIAGDLEAAEAAEILTRSAKGFNLTAAETDELLGILNYTSNNYATSTGKLGDAIARVSPITAQLGFTMKETAGLVTPIIEVFQDSEQASTAVRSALLNLKDDTSSVTEAFTRLGFSSEYIFNRQMMSGRDILYDVAGAWQSLDAPMKDYVANLLFGKEQAAKMLVLLEKWPTVTKIAATSTEEMAASVEKELATRLQTAQIQIDRLINSFQNLAASVGDQFRAAAAGAAGGLADLEEAVRKAVTDKTFEPFFAAVRRFAESAGAVFRGVAQALPEALSQVDFSGLIRELDSVGADIGGFLDGLDLTSADGLAKAIQFLTDTFQSLIVVTRGIAAQFIPFFEAIGEVIRQVNDMDRETQLAFGQILGSAKLIVEAGAEIAAAFFLMQQSGSNVQTVFDAVIGSTRALWNAVQTAFDSVALAITEAVQLALGAAEALASIPGIPDSWGEGAREARASVLEFQQAIELDRMAQVGELLDAGAQAWRGFTGQTREARAAVDETSRAMGAVPEIVSTRVDVERDQADEDLAALRARLDEAGVLVIGAAVDGASVQQAQADVAQAIPARTGTVVEASVDDRSLTQARGYIESTLADGTRLFTDVGLDRQSLERTKGKIRGELNAVETKDVKATVELETARLDADTKLMLRKMELASEDANKLLDFNAKLQLAEFEAGTKRMELTLGNLGRTIDSTGSTMTDLFGQIEGGQVLFGEKNRLLRNQIEEEAKMRREAHEANMRLLALQERMSKAQLDAMNREDGGLNISVTADNLAAPLEMIFNEVIRLAWVRGVENKAQFLTMIQGDVAGAGA